MVVNLMLSNIHLLSGKIQLLFLIKSDVISAAIFKKPRKMLKSGSILQCRKFVT